MGLKEKILGLVDNGVSQTMSMLNEVDKTISKIDWDKQFKFLNEKKDSILKKGDELLNEFSDLMKQVKVSVSDYEVSIPYDASIGEKFDYSIDGNKLNIEVSFEDETSERSNKVRITIPEGLDVKNVTTKRDDSHKTMTVIIPKIIAEPTQKTSDTTTNHSEGDTTPKNDDGKTHASSKLMETIRRNSSRVAMPRGANGRFVRRTPNN